MAANAAAQIESQRAAGRYAVVGARARVSKWQRAHNLRIYFVRNFLFLSSDPTLYRLYEVLSGAADPRESRAFAGARRLWRGDEGAYARGVWRRHYERDRL